MTQQEVAQTATIKKTVQIAMAIIGALVVMYMLSMVTMFKFENLRISNFYKSSAQESADYNMKQLDCLAKNIYWEAANEPFEGKVAVAQVTLNRANHSKYPDDICQVVYQKSKVYEKVICQFSWVCENKHKVRPVNPEAFAEAKKVAKLVMFEDLRLPSLQTAIFYHADYVNPGWRYPRLTKIGRHIFYKG